MPLVIEKTRAKVRVRELSKSEADYWNRGVQNFETVHPLNAFGWGQVRSVDDWIPIYLCAEREGKFCGGMLVLEKRIPFIPFSLFYSPKGPVCRYEDDETLYALIEKVKEIAARRKATFLRIDPNLQEDYIKNDSVDKFSLLGFVHLDHRWTYWNSPADVSRINLTRVDHPDELFNMLDRDTRRCIRKAAREGVNIEAATSEDELKTFYTIFKDFTVNKKFMSRDYEYQKGLWDHFITRGCGRLFLAKYKGEIIGGLICIMFGRKCLAMHMGTPYQYQKLQTYYAYVWESIRWAKENDCYWYSFRGVGTTHTQEYFKKKFLPDIVNLIGYYDLPFRPLLYKLFHFGEFSLLPRTWPYMVSLRKVFSKIMKRSGRV